ncbi:MAG: toxin HipA [Deltaproteobacteria bacterium RIFOXYD12_FULL_50_9]|nr:MAG: toxin HipA [Deltaproteobacteria bacterium RIFOXYD12_FULL_50_9]
MVKQYSVAKITLWGQSVGAVAWDNEKGLAFFEYDQKFLKEGLNIAPLTMDIANAKDVVFSFPILNRDTFKRLPGLLADVLPDKYGNAIIDAWLARQGRDARSFSPVERLCYTGKRGMGALEFAPDTVKGLNKSVSVEIKEITQLAHKIMSRQASLDVNLNDNDPENEEAMRDIIRIGTSAGGARPKAIIAMNKEGHVLSGQAKAPNGYDYWILKLDGVADLELGEPRNYGRIEYAYHLMAKAAGIKMTECRLHKENGRAHFLTKRFDRANGDKVHMQTLCGIAHYDFNMAGAYGYEQAFDVMRRLGLDHAQAVQQYKRMVFNVLARNQDDHTKNITFLMDKEGKWSLSPAYDVTYSHNPKGDWTNQHQMTINGKRDHFILDDLVGVGKAIKLSNPMLVISEVFDAVVSWPEFADEAGVPKETAENIKKYHRLELGKGHLPKSKKAR